MKSKRYYTLSQTVQSVFLNENAEINIELNDNLFSMKTMFFETLITATFLFVEATLQLLLDMKSSCTVVLLLMYYPCKEFSVYKKKVKHVHS